MKTLWRADTYTEVVEKVNDVSDDAPVGVWLMPMLGDGYYAYEESEKEAKRRLGKYLEENAKNLQEQAKALLTSA